MKYLSTAQLSTYLQVTKRTIQRRAVRGNWSYMIKKDLGGTRRLYEFATLPTKVKNRVIAEIIAKHERIGLEYSTDEPTQRVLNIDNNPFIVAKKTEDQDWLTQHIFAEQSPHPLDTVEQQKEYIKIGLLQLAYLYVLSFYFRKIKGFDEFCHLYNSRQLALKSAVYQVVGKVSRITLLRWEKQLKPMGEPSGSLNANSKQATMIDKDLIEIAQELFIISSNLTAKRLKQYFLTIFSDRHIPSEAQLSSWLKLQQSLAI